MDVILLDRIDKLGNLGDKVKVKPGYARNYLIPQGKATSATKEHVADFEARRAEIERVAAESKAQAETRSAALAVLTVTLTSRAGEEGKLFGSIGTADIAEAVTAAGVALEKHEVRLPNGPLRQTGMHEVSVHLHTDVNTVVKIVIAAED